MTDLEFVQSCANGDALAWDEFLKRYSRLIYSYILTVFKSSGYAPSQGQPQDIFQDLILILIKDDFRKLKSFQARNGCSLAGWLKQVTVNFTIDCLRKLKPAFSLEEENEEGLSFKDLLLDSASSAAESVNKKELFGYLAGCIDKLEIKDKYFLELHLGRGITLEDLKKHFRVSRGAIDMRKSRIVDRLRECFKKKGILKS
jgi:RNA polymerase sigma-70 factor, ECF subfamily